MSGTPILKKPTVAEFDGPSITSASTAKPSPPVFQDLRLQPAMTTTTLTNRIRIRELWAQYTNAILANDNRRADNLRAEISRAEREELQSEC